MVGGTNVKMDVIDTKYTLVPQDNVSVCANIKKIDDNSLALEQKSLKNKKGTRIGKRYIQILWLSNILITMYLMRISISVTIVAMTDPNPIYKDVPVYTWPDKSLILSGFLWGYFVPQPFAGWASTRFGGKWFLVGALVASSVLNAVVPFCAAYFGSVGVLVVRIFLGISQSFLYPTLNNMLGKWGPTQERSRLGCLIFAGSSLGIVLSMVISGYLCSTRYGWPIVFYTFGAIGIIVALFYSYIGCNSPAQHTTISTEERYYIESNLPKISHTEKLDTPWKDIFTSLSFWALFIAECGNNFGHWTLLSQIPSYLNHVMKFDIKSYGELSSLPYLLQWIMAYVYGFLTDWIITRKVTSITSMRKIMNGIAFLGPALALILIGNSDSESKIYVLVLLMVGVSCISAGKSGHLINYVDLSPNHAGTIMGIANGSSIGFASLGNVMVHFIVTDDQNSNQWRIIFYCASAIYVFATIVYCVFGSGEVQPWNEKKAKHRALI